MIRTPLSLVLLVFSLSALASSAQEAPRRRRRRTLYQVEHDQQHHQHQHHPGIPQVATAHSDEAPNARRFTNEFGEQVEIKAVDLDWDDEEWSRLLQDDMSMSVTTRTVARKAPPQSMSMSRSRLTHSAGGTLRHRKLRQNRQKQKEKRQQGLAEDLLERDDEEWSRFLQDDMSMSVTTRTVARKAPPEAMSMSRSRLTRSAGGTRRRRKLHKKRQGQKHQQELAESLLERDDEEWSRFLQDDMSMSVTTRTVARRAPPQSMSMSRSRLTRSAGGTRRRRKLDQARKNKEFQQAGGPSNLRRFTTEFGEELLGEDTLDWDDEDWSRFLQDDMSMSVTTRTVARKAPPQSMSMSRSRLTRSAGGTRRGRMLNQAQQQDQSQQEYQHKTAKTIRGALRGRRGRMLNKEQQQDQSQQEYQRKVPKTIRGALRGGWHFFF